MATITEVAQYLRLLHVRLGVQHHPETGQAEYTPSRTGRSGKLLLRVLGTAKARKSPISTLCSPLSSAGAREHHQPIADWIGRQGYALMRADGKV